MFTKRRGTPYGSRTRFQAPEMKGFAEVILVGGFAPPVPSALSRTLPVVYGGIVRTVHNQLYFSLSKPRFRMRTRQRGHGVLENVIFPISFSKL